MESVGKTHRNIFNINHLSELTTILPVVNGNQELKPSCLTPKPVHRFFALFKISWKAISRTERPPLGRVVGASGCLRQHLSLLTRMNFYAHRHGRMVTVFIFYCTGSLCIISL